MKCLAMSPMPFHHIRTARRALNPILRFPQPLFASSMSADPMVEAADLKLGEFFDYMEKLKNHERLGVPKGAGTDSGDGFDLGRMRRLLQRLGDPHTQFKAVHIAGTKGKGSTAAFVSNILREEGYNVGCYTSPHLLTIRERISLGRNGDPISAGVLRNLFDQLKGILDQSIELESGTLTHFEVFTALAFSAFSQEKVDFAMIEAGLGGARDATNVLRSTELATSVITSIGWAISEKSIRAGLERTRLLGRSQILTHKEAEAVGLPGAAILVDGAHTEASAEGLAGTIKMMNPRGPLALVVAMASDKDHKAFAKQLLSVTGTKPEVVLLTEVSIAGGKFRMASASALRDSWIMAAADSHIEVSDIGMIDPETVLEARVNYLQSFTDSKSLTLIGCHVAGVSDTMKVADRLLRLKTGGKSGLIALTGSLHIAAAVLTGAHH